MSDAANKGQWLRGASVSGLDYTDILTKILRSAPNPSASARAASASGASFTLDNISSGASAAVAAHVNHAMKQVAGLAEEMTTQSADRTISTNRAQTSTDKAQGVSEASEMTTTSTEPVNDRAAPTQPPQFFSTRSFSSGGGSAPVSTAASVSTSTSVSTAAPHTDSPSSAGPIFSSSPLMTSGSSAPTPLLTLRFPFSTADDSSSTEQEYNTKLPDEPDIVKPPNLNMPPKSVHPLASVLSDEAIERFKKDALWSNFLDIYPRKNHEATELELSRLDSSSRLKPMAIDGVPRHSPYAFYSSFSETVPTLHQSVLNPGIAPPGSMLSSELAFWWQSPYLIYGLVILFSAVLLMSMTLQCCVIYSQRRQIEYLRDESVRSRTCASIPSYLMRVPANTEVMHPRISDGVVPSATTNIGSRTLDELVDEVERRITKQLIKYNQRTLPPFEVMRSRSGERTPERRDVRTPERRDVRTPERRGERTPERRAASARNLSARPPHRARTVMNSGGSSSTSFSPQSVVRVDQQHQLSLMNSSRSLEEPTEMLSVAINSSSSPSTPSTLNPPRRKAPATRIKASSRMS